ncbi:unnamed protein product [Onchocerca flexuosa]|uniref:ZP domain-containing protein n=1 Tax=Onchocerca flexuosa TaxID=387005 RepID=A0A183HYI5_9BILA|nr:unnamed protein product [Onchocerca flexuosa]
MRSVVVLPEVFFITLLSQWVWTLKEPILECYMNGLRLFFESEKPFYGHIYVQESFVNERCHLDFTQKPLDSTKEPPGYNYNIVVVVQYHYLFLTQGDRIYHVKCFYRKDFDNLNQNVKVNSVYCSIAISYSSFDAVKTSCAIQICILSNVLTTTELSSENMMKCVYEVLTSVSGKPVKYANVGDQLTHTWSCASEKYGMLIHSCFVRISDENAFQLVDDQGCITDSTLMDPLKYSNDLTKAYSVIPAFKFVDQLVLHFQCKVTACIKAKNGCEGISPPDCKTESSGTVLTEQKSTTTKLANSTSSVVSPDLDQLCEVMQQDSIDSEIIPMLLIIHQVIIFVFYYIPNSTNELNFFTLSDLGQNKTRNYKRKRSANKSEITMDSLSRKFLILMNSTIGNRFTLDVNANQEQEMKFMRNDEEIEVAFIIFISNLRG